MTSFENICVRRGENIYTHKRENQMGMARHQDNLRRMVESSKTQKKTFPTHFSMA